MDKKNRQRFDQTEKNEAKYMRKATNEYGLTYSEIRQIILQFIASYGDDGKLTNDMYKYGRWDNLIKQVYEQLTGIKLASPRQMDTYFKNQYQYNYLNTAYILETKYQSKLGIKELGRKSIPTINTMSKVALQVDSDALRGNLRRALAQSISQGEGIGKSSERIKKALEKNMNNALRITRTETTRAMNEANQRAMEKAVKIIPIQKRWDAVLDGKTRRAHRRADGQVVDVDKPFIVDGEKLMYPGDPNGSPENVINCRCVSTEIIKGYDSPQQYRRARGVDGENKVIPYITYNEWAKNRL